MRDYQKSRVYAWERKHLPSGGKIEFPNAQAIVNYVWSDYGLNHPPMIELMPAQCTRFAGDATRLKIRFQGMITLRVILHEVAHSMTSNIYGESAMHGPLFVGMYAKLLQKYMNVDIFHIIATCGVENVDININAQPIFLD